MPTIENILNNKPSHKVTQLYKGYYSRQFGFCEFTPTVEDQTERFVNQIEMWGICDNEKKNHWQDRIPCEFDTFIVNPLTGDLVNPIKKWGKYYLGRNTHLHDLTQHIISGHYPTMHNVSNRIPGNIGKINSESGLENLEQIFRTLTQNWHIQTKAHSSISRKVKNIYYKTIIALGQGDRQIVTLILKELQKKPDHWFQALEEITQEDPIRKDDFGNMETMRNRWIEWGKKNNYL